MTPSTATRNASFYQHRDSGQLGAQQERVMKAFHSLGAQRDYSSKELAWALGMERSSVCGRLNELVALGFLEWGEPRKCCMSGRVITPAKLPGSQRELF